MNILLIFPGFIIAFIIVLYYERKVRDLSAKTKNNVHFYVARDKNRSLWVYMCKPVRNNDEFKATIIVAPRWRFEYFGLNENDYADLKWEDEPVEVFLNLEN